MGPLLISVVVFLVLAGAASAVVYFGNKRAAPDAFADEPGRKQRARSTWPPRACRLLTSK